jgi:hypothetical protein
MGPSQGKVCAFEGEDHKTYERGSLPIIAKVLDVSLSVANLLLPRSARPGRWSTSGAHQVIYEIRVYQAVEGKADAMRLRFKNELIPRMPRHGIELVGAFVSPADDGKLTYLTRFTTEEAR